ncbi:MAG TPA: glucose 1-dehydrogenase [Clostridiales bacterium]|nr:glucose 1-dehydrogenase [Clostridiales bacterium]
MDFNFIQSFPKTVPEQHQNQQPGLNSKMNPKPIDQEPQYVSSNKLAGKVALVTGGDSGIGRAVAIAFAHEGADIAIVYSNEHEDAQETKAIIEGTGRKCLVYSGDIGEESLSSKVVNNVVKELGRIDILVNNAGEQHPQNSILDITKEQLERTFKTNIFGMFFMTKAVLPHLAGGSAIINTTSITAFKGHETLIDYSASKGAILAFTRSLALNLAEMNIRVNAVAPGPVWTPLIPASFSPQEVGKFGGDTPMGRPGQPVELAKAYVYLASGDSSYVSGQTIHVNGGIIVNG